MVVDTSRTDIPKPEEADTAEDTTAAAKLLNSAIAGWITAMDLALQVAALVAVRARGHDTIGCNPTRTSEDMQQVTIRTLPRATSSLERQSSPADQTVATASHIRRTRAARTAQLNAEDR